MRTERCSPKRQPSSAKGVFLAAGAPWALAQTKAGVRRVKSFRSGPWPAMARTLVGKMPRQDALGGGLQLTWCWLPAFFFCLIPYPVSMFLGITFRINSLNLCLRGNPKRSHRVTGAVSSLDRPIHASAQGLYWEGPNSWRTGVFKSSLNAHRAPQRTGIRRIFRGLTRKLRKFQLPTSS